MTRGHEANTAHLVADDLDDAREQWVTVFSRDRADLGPAHAAKLAAARPPGTRTGPSVGRGAETESGRGGSHAGTAPDPYPGAAPRRRCAHPTVDPRQQCRAPGCRR